MPEIAEVRTVARTLNKQIIGKRIIGIDILYNKIIKSDKEEFVNILKDKVFRNVYSIGKWLVFDMGEYSFLSHLRMEGKYFVKESNSPIVKHEHVIFHLDNNYDLRYHDVRKFGVMILVKSAEVNMISEISKLGIEPDSDNLTSKYIFDKIKNSNKSIKELLLDQSIINGLGNIYVDEVLFASKINPLRKGKNISLDECELIKENSSRIIGKATLCGGTTIRSYTSSLGVEGTYQKYLMVHTREGKKCLVCGTIIEKIRVGGRGTYYCPKCQRIDG